MWSHVILQHDIQQQFDFRDYTEDDQRSLIGQQMFEDGQQLGDWPSGPYVLLTSPTFAFSY